MLSMPESSLARRLSVFLDNSSHVLTLSEQDLDKLTAQLAEIEAAGDDANLPAHRVQLQE
jgi:hypothetical protein